MSKLGATSCQDLERNFENRAGSLKIPKNVQCLWFFNADDNFSGDLDLDNALPDGLVTASRGFYAGEKSGLENFSTFNEVKL